MTEIILPDLEFWWRWLPIYTFIAGGIIGGLITGLVKSLNMFDFYSMLAYVILIAGIVFVGTTICFEGVKDEKITEAVSKQANLGNFVRTGDSFVGEDSDGEFVSGFIIERDGKLGYVLD